jgi:uncharacterized protein with HEPN domain
MPSKTPENRLLHIRDAIHTARGFIGAMPYETFRDNQLVFYGVTRCLEIISEASKTLPDDIKARYPDIPWRDMADAGNIYRHEYEDVQQRIVWQTVQTRFDALLAMAESELKLRPAKP